MSQLSLNVLSSQCWSPGQWAESCERKMDPPGDWFLWLSRGDTRVVRGSPIFCTCVFCTKREGFEALGNPACLCISLWPCEAGNAAGAWRQQNSEVGKHPAELPRQRALCPSKPLLALDQCLTKAAVSQWRHCGPKHSRASEIERIGSGEANKLTCSGTVSILRNIPKSSICCSIFGCNRADSACSNKRGTGGFAKPSSGNASA